MTSNYVSKFNDDDKVILDNYVKVYDSNYNIINNFHNDIDKIRRMEAEVINKLPQKNYSIVSLYDYDSEYTRKKKLIRLNENLHNAIYRMLRNYGFDFETRHVLKETSEKLNIDYIIENILKNEVKFANINFEEIKELNFRNMIIEISRKTIDKFKRPTITHNKNKLTVESCFDLYYRCLLNLLLAFNNSEVDITYLPSDLALNGRIIKIKRYKNHKVEIYFKDDIQLKQFFNYCNF